MTAEQGSPTTERSTSTSLTWMNEFVERIEAEAYEQGRKAGLTEAIEAVEGLDYAHGPVDWPKGKSMEAFRVRLVGRAAVIDTLTRLRDGS